MVSNSLKPYTLLTLDRVDVVVFAVSLNVSKQLIRRAVAWEKCGASKFGAHAGNEVTLESPKRHSVLSAKIPLCLTMPANFCLP